MKKIKIFLNLFVFYCLMPTTNLLYSDSTPYSFLTESDKEKFDSLFEDYSNSFKIQNIFFSKPNIINYTHPRYKQTPLNYAFKNKNLELVKALISHGARPCYNTGYTNINPINISIEQDWPNVLQQLLQFGVSPNFTTTKHQNAPLFLAVDKSSAKMLKILLEYKADLNIKDIYGNSLLWRAYLKNSIEPFEVLLKAGVDPNQKNRFEETLLIKAIINGKLEIAKLLLEYGANIFDTDEFGKNAIEYASKNKKANALLQQFIEKEKDLSSELKEATFFLNLQKIKILVRKGAKDSDRWAIEYHTKRGPQNNSTLYDQILQELKKAQ